MGKTYVMQFELGLLHPDFREHCEPTPPFKPGFYYYNHSDYIAARCAVSRAAMLKEEAMERLSEHQLKIVKKLAFLDSELARAAVQLQHQYDSEADQEKFYYDSGEPKRQYVTDVAKKSILFDLHSHTHNERTLEKRTKDFNKKCEEFLGTQPRGANVRIGLNVFAAWRTNAISYQEFAVLCAINAILGKKKYSRITQERIHAACHGYTSTKKFNEDNRPERWTPHTTRRIIEKLVKLNFIGKVTYKKRVTYYSSQLRKEKELLAAVAKAKEKKIVSDYKARTQSNTLDAHLESFEAIVRGRSNIAEQLTLDLYTGDKLYSMKWFAAKNVPSDDIAMLLKTATVVTIQGNEFYSFSNKTADEVLELFNETQQRRITGATQKELDHANQMIQNYKRKRL